MIQKLREAWKRCNTTYWYAGTFEEMLDGRGSIVGEFHNPWYKKLGEWFYYCWPRRKLRNLKYWVAHRTYDKYHTAWLGFEPGYKDKDTRIEGAILQLFKDFIEKEEDDAFRDWISRPFHTDETDPQEIKWDKERYDKWEPVYCLYLKVMGKQPWDFEEKELTKILIEIIKIRGYLWT